MADISRDDIQAGEQVLERAHRVVGCRIFPDLVFDVRIKAWQDNRAHRQSGDRGHQSGCCPDRPG